MIFKLSQNFCVFLLVVAISLLVSNCFGEICPDHKKSCRKGQTCCDDKQGGFGCCPYENATCCTDGLHCCPEGTQCDLAGGRCRRNKQMKQIILVPSLDNNAINIEDEGNAYEGPKQQCPDLKQSCPDTYTCCQDPQHGYACCPYTNATCCSDKIHCCPNGTSCASGRCQ